MLRLVIWILLIHCAAFVQAQGIVQVSDGLEERNFMPNELVYLIDPTNELDFKTISSPEYATRFKQHSSYQNVDFKTNSSYWIRLSIRHNPTTSKVWLLEFYDQTIDYIDAYVPDQNGKHRLIRMGDQHPFEQRLFRHKNFEVLLDMKSDTLMNYYFRVQSNEFVDMRIALRSVNRFVYYALNEYFLFGTFYGMILIISLYNFLVYVAIREMKNLYYIFYILSVAAYAMSLDGIGFQFLWPAHPEWNNYATGITLYSVILWALVFTRKFLATSTNATRIDRLLTWTIIVRTVVFVVQLFFFPDWLPYRNFDIIPLSIIFYSAILSWSRGYRPARFFVIAYGVLFTGFFLRTMVFFNVLPFTTLTHYSLHISFVLEMLFLTFALGDRIRILKDMRDRALRRIITQHELNMQLKEKVNRELEKKVLERTVEIDAKNRELEEANQKLIAQSDKINQINAMLDLDNWKLRKNIKEVLNERLQEKPMDYEQFQTLYPDNLSCYRFLETLKWNDDFACRKCGNEKYFPGSAKFARRCTRCGYNESITTNTIFHGIKFPIEKAFYIAYLTVTGHREHTLEELAGKLQLSVNAIWAFKGKVSDRITSLSSTGKRVSASGWDAVILDSTPQKTASKKLISEQKL